MAKPIDINPDGKPVITSVTARPIGPSHAANVEPLQGASTYPGGPTTQYYARCSCGYRAPVRMDSYSSQIDVEQHLQDPSA